MTDIPTPPAATGSQASYWTAHSGEDYSVVMRPDETTDGASICLRGRDPGLARHIANCLNRAVTVSVTATGSQAQDREALDLDSVPEPMRSALVWLKAALECKTWHWDADQHEAATRALHRAARGTRRPSGAEEIPQPVVPRGDRGSYQRGYDNGWNKACVAFAALSLRGDAETDAPAAAEAQAGAELRAEVLAFAYLMEAQLRANDHKPGWKGEPPEPLWERLREEATELLDAIRPGSRTTAETHQAEVGAEAADVANFAMMIADVCGALRPTPATPAPASAPAVDGEDDWRKPPPHFVPDKRWQRQPQSVEEWDRLQDPPGDQVFRAKRRLAFAGDLADPRAPKGMALVSRWDISSVLMRLTWLEARFENTQDAALPPPRADAAADEHVEALRFAKSALVLIAAGHFDDPRAAARDYLDHLNERARGADAAADDVAALRRQDILEKMQFERVVDVLSDLLSSLTAAHSLLKRGGKKAVASDKMFEQMLEDYEAAIERGRGTYAFVRANWPALASTQRKEG